MTWDQFKSKLTPIEGPLVDFYVEVIKHRHLQLVEKSIEILEVGSGWGLFTRSAMEAVPGDGILVTTIDKIPIQSLKTFNENVEGFEHRIERIEESSRTALPRIIAKGDRKFDIIFVDGDHGYEGAKADLENAWKLLKGPGSILMVDDVFHKHNFDGGDYGVAKALWEFMNENLAKDEVNVGIGNVAHGVAVIIKS